jgi:hypothetical protein
MSFFDGPKDKIIGKRVKIRERKLCENIYLDFVFGG